MLALERRNMILEKLQEEKRVVVSELSQLYNVSEETIRRDLDKLEKEGLATKSYGGAVIPFKRISLRYKDNIKGSYRSFSCPDERSLRNPYTFLFQLPAFYRGQFLF